jgi:hypothetical protein
VRGLPSDAWRFVVWGALQAAASARAGADPRAPTVGRDVRAALEAVVGALWWRRLWGAARAEALAFQPPREAREEEDRA